MHTPQAEPPLHLAVTTGEPAGVGPELTLHALASALPADAGGKADAWHDVHFTLLGDADLIAQRAPCVAVDLPALLAGGRVTIEHIPLAVPCRAGQLDAANGRYVLALLDRAIEGAVGGRFDGI